MMGSALGVLVALTSFMSMATSRPVVSQIQGLPVGASVLASVQLIGLPEKAIVYASQGYVLGVVSVPDNRLVWSRRLPAAATQLQSSPQTGVFKALVPRTGWGQVFAFRVKGTFVRSVITGRGTGEIAGSESAALTLTGFTVVDHDRQHMGSIPYRIVSTYRWTGAAFARSTRVRKPDMAASEYPVPNAVIHTAAGDTILLKLEVADTEATREVGLMNRTSMDPDSGMIFVWTQPATESFWMYNTFIPLTVAFLDGQGKILETLDMSPLTTDLHTPSESYLYAVEVNLGFFKANGIRVGDRAVLHLTRP